MNRLDRRLPVTVGMAMSVIVWLAAGSTPAPHVLAERAEIARSLQKTLLELPEDERAAVALCCQEGLSLAAAAVLGRGGQANNGSTDPLRGAFGR
jgi:DNA-directed RNA polymerase specialized sigma24 family protein